MGELCTSVVGIAVRCAFIVAPERNLSLCLPLFWGSTVSLWPYATSTSRHCDMHYTCGLMQPGSTLLASFDLHSGFPEIDNTDSFMHFLLGILISLDVCICTVFAYGVYTKYMFSNCQGFQPCFWRLTVQQSLFLTCFTTPAWDFPVIPKSLIS